MDVQNRVYLDIVSDYDISTAVCKVIVNSAVDIG